MEDLLNALDYAEVNLSDDIQALGYLIDEYFSSTKTSDNFKYSYCEIQNAIQALLKSMIYNRDRIKRKVEEAYKIEKSMKEGISNA